MPGTCHFCHFLSPCPPTPARSSKADSQSGELPRAEGGGHASGACGYYTALPGDDISPISAARDRHQDSWVSTTPGRPLPGPSPRSGNRTAGAKRALVGPGRPRTLSGEGAGGDAEDTASPPPLSFFCLISVPNHQFLLIQNFRQTLTKTSAEPGARGVTAARGPKDRAGLPPDCPWAPGCCSPAPFQLRSDPAVSRDGCPGNP